MNYSEAVTWLEKATSFGIKPGLTRIEALLRHLGNPEKKYKVIHITGTNGKGSTAAMVTAALEGAGLTVGRYTSPHLVEYTERIYAGGQDIPREDFAEAATFVSEAAEKVKKEGIEAPTEFELLTAMAFYYFAQKKIDYAVVEVGMGGLYDSTNVVMPEVSVITNVAMDHMKYLGNTISEIAAQKAGIIKEGVPAVTCATGDALKVIRETAEKKHARLYVFGEDAVINERKPVRGGQILSITIDGRRYNDVHIPLVGEHQVENAAAALMALHVVCDMDKRVSRDQAVKGIENTRWPGRFEIHKMGNLPFIMDGAHNSAGAVTLKQSLEEQFPDERRIFVFTSLSDKDTDKVIDLLMRKNDKVFITTAPTPRSRTTKEIAAMLPCAYKEETSTEQALEDAVSEAKEGDIVVVCGSLYILGQVITWLRKFE